MEPWGLCPAAPHNKHCIAMASKQVRKSVLLLHPSSPSHGPALLANSCNKLCSHTPHKHPLHYILHTLEHTSPAQRQGTCEHPHNADTCHAMITSSPYIGAKLFHTIIPGHPSLSGPGVNACYTAEWLPITSKGPCKGCTSHRYHSHCLGTEILHPTHWGHL